MLHVLCITAVAAIVFMQLPVQRIYTPIRRCGDSYGRMHIALHGASVNSRRRRSLAVVILPDMDIDPFFIKVVAVCTFSQSYRVEAVKDEPSLRDCSSDLEDIQYTVETYCLRKKVSLAHVMRDIVYFLSCVLL